jgi:DNA-binding NarL/FixJ family response regulator
VLRVLIADDHAVLRAGLRALVNSTDDLEIVGEAATAAEAVVRASELAPDVIVMDLQLPDASGIVATQEIVERSPDARVLILTMFDDEDSVFAAMRVGARGYALKGAEEEDLLRAIRAVAGGDAIFSPAVAQRMLAFFAGAPTRPARAFPDLSDREREVLELLARGSGNAQIANSLHLSPKTVRNYVSAICLKLQVSDRAHAALKARDAGLGRAPVA